MKKILSSVAVVLTILALTGCSSLRGGKSEAVEPGQAKAILVDVVGGKAEVGKVQNEFHYGDMVYMYVTLGWNDGQRVQTLNAKWYNATGQVVATKIYKPEYLRNPHHVWFWINSAQLGKGAVRAEVTADGKLFSIPFTVLEPLKKEPKKPWYQRIFKKKPVEEKPIETPKGIQF